MSSRILRLPTVILRTGLSRSTIYARIGDGTFPRQVALGAGSVGWREAELDAWIDHLTWPAKARPGVG